MQDPHDAIAWMRTPRVRNVTVAVAAVLVLIGLLLVTVGSADAVCSACHTKQAAAGRRGAHAKTSCYSCHLDRGAWSTLSRKTDELTRMYPLALVGGVPSGPARMTAGYACLRCHAKVLEGVTVAKNLRIRHLVCAAGPSCDPCHSPVAHGDAVRWRGAPIMERCTACHKERGVSVECVTCHTDGSARGRRVRGPWQVTHGPEWRSTHGMGDLRSCSTCHPRDFCVKCHKVAVPHAVEFGGEHGRLAEEDRKSCAVCHRTPALCDACHGIEMPHPAGFLRRHSKTARGDHDPSCFRCHADSDCAACHTNHAHPGGGRGVPVPWTSTRGGP